MILDKSNNNKKPSWYLGPHRRTLGRKYLLWGFNQYIIQHISCKSLGEAQNGIALAAPKIIIPLLSYYLLLLL